jgi:hypothetical protein
MKTLRHLEQTHTDSCQAIFTVYRTPSAADAAETAAALTLNAYLLNFLPPATVCQPSPGIYEVRIAYGPDVAGEDFEESLIALNRVLEKVLLARLDERRPTLPDLAPSRASRPSSDIIVGLHRMPSPWGDSSYIRSH